MLTTYTPAEGRVVIREGLVSPEALRAAVWIDLLNPTPEEERAVQQALRLEIPTREEMEEIESSSRLYREEDALFLTANFLYGVEGGEFGSTADHLRPRPAGAGHGALPDAEGLQRLLRPLPEEPGARRLAGRRDAAPVRADRGPARRHPGTRRLRHGPRLRRRLPQRAVGHREGQQARRGSARDADHPRPGRRGDDARLRDAARPDAHPDLRRRREGDGRPQGEPDADQDAGARRPQPGGSRRLPEQQGAVPAGRRARHHQCRADEHHQDLHRRVRRADAADADRQHLRHELPAHARAGGDLGLSGRARADGRARRCCRSSTSSAKGGCDAARRGCSCCRSCCCRACPWRSKARRPRRRPRRRRPSPARRAARRS